MPARSIGVALTELSTTDRQHRSISPHQNLSRENASTGRDRVPCLHLLVEGERCGRSQRLTKSLPGGVTSGPTESGGRGEPWIETRENRRTWDGGDRGDVDCRSRRTRTHRLAGRPTTGRASQTAGTVDHRQRLRRIPPKTPIPACFAFNQATAWADPLLLVPLQVGASIGMLRVNDGDSCSGSLLPCRSGTPQSSSTSGTATSAFDAAASATVGDVAGLRDRRKHLLLCPTPRLT